MSEPIYSQRDPAWAALHYGLERAAPSSTIGAYGCGITAIAQKLTLHGMTTTPAEVQAEFLRLRCYKPYGSFNFINWPDVPNVYQKLQYNGRHDYSGNTPVSPRVMSMIRDRLAQHDQVIVYVDALRYVDGLQQHFVLVVGELSSGFIINNPWDGAVQNMRSYAATDTLAIRGVVLLDWKA